jgi:hypothetical protein
MLILSTSILFKSAFLPFLIIAYFVFVFSLPNDFNSLSQIMKRLMNLIIPIISVVVALNFFVTETSHRFGLQKSFPEQQVMIYDLAAIHCWSNNSAAQDFAGNILSPLASQIERERSICKFLVPYGWDTLRVEQSNWNLIQPIRVIPPNDSSSFKALREGWLQTLGKYPFDWLSAKATFLGHILFMSNSLDHLKDFPSSNPVLASLFFIFRLPSMLLDFTLLSTVAASLLFYLLILMFGKRSILARTPLMLLLLGTANQVLVYVSNNGRYVFNMILIVWIYYLNSVKETPIET